MISFCQDKIAYCQANLEGLAGLDEYQVTGWRGWPHHIAMVLLVRLFLFGLKRKLAPKAPRLTLKDSVEILKIVMPK